MTRHQTLLVAKVSKDSICFLANDMLCYITGRVAGYSYGYSSSSTPYLHLTGGMNFFVDPEV